MLKKENIEDFKHAGLSDLEIKRFEYILDSAIYTCDYENNNVYIELFDVHNIIQSFLYKQEKVSTCPLCS